MSESRLPSHHTMVHAPEYTEAVHRAAQKLDKISDEVDDVNVAKLKAKAYEAKDFGGHDNQQSVLEKDGSAFRAYDDACDRVKNFYAEQHRKQTVEFNTRMRREFEQQKRATMTVWEAIELLDTLVDDSDPDTSLSQIQHLLQTAEAMRRDGKPDWMQVTGLVHDLGKLLCFFGADGQWDVVGDTFAVGCKFSDKNIYPETFKENPDWDHPVYSTENGIYEPGCGLDKVMLSWGHDEYLYHICKKQSTLPDEALAMIRYHSFYPWHREGAYMHLCNEHDIKMLDSVREFNPYDLYSKSDDPPSVEKLRPYYEGLIAKYFNEKIDW